MSQNLTFKEFFAHSENYTKCVVEALSLMSTSHPVFRNNIVLQDIITGKNRGFTNADLLSIIKMAFEYSISISKKSVNQQLDKQLAINTEVHTINTAINYLNFIRFQQIQDSITNLSEVEYIRRYSKGKINAQAS